MRIYQNMNATSSRLALLAVLLILKMRKTVFCRGPNGHSYPEKKKWVKSFTNSHELWEPPTAPPCRAEFRTSFFQMYAYTFNG